jgi:required for meiotic nuclear division protein 1
MAKLKHGTKNLAVSTGRKPKEFFLETYYLGDHIDLKKVQESLQHYHLLNQSHPLVLELLPGQFAVLTKFGTVSFWNVGADLARQFTEELLPFVESPRDPHRRMDTLNIYVGTDVEKATFEELYIKTIDLEKIKIVSYVSAQSVALERYEKEIDERLRDLGKVVENLKAAGTTRFNQSDLLKQIGHVLSVKQNAVSSLSLFDKPEETWEREEIEQLYDRLRTEYELRDRFDILNEKIDFLSENNTTLLNFISSQKANFLEWIVIILIVIELIVFVLDILKVFP